MTATYALNAYLDFPRIRRATAEDLPAIRALQAESLRTLGRRHYEGRLLDLFIGDEEQTGRGLGTEMIERFVEEIVFARPETIACIADPDLENAASMRAFEKAGFRAVRELVDPEDGRLHALMRRERADPS